MKDQIHILEILRNGSITSLHLAPWGSNYTFLARVQLGGQETIAVYKPKIGEAPLWDFPAGTLYKRECASYILSRILGWNFIPITLIRDGPYGIGSVQAFIDHNPGKTYFTIRNTDPDALRIIACFDLLTNNADRKPVHCIEDDTKKVWGIDHGLTFNSVNKLRTAIWDFQGEWISNKLISELERLNMGLSNPSAEMKEFLSLLDQQEIQGLTHRLSWILRTQKYPSLLVR